MATEEPSLHVVDQLDQPYDPYQPGYQGSHHWTSKSNYLLDGRAMGTGRHGWALDSGTHASFSSSRPSRYQKVGRSQKVDNLRTHDPDVLVVEPVVIRRRMEEGDSVEGGGEDGVPEYDPCQPNNISFCSKDTRWVCGSGTRVIEGNEQRVKSTTISMTGARTTKASQSTVGAGECGDSLLNQGNVERYIKPVQEMQFGDHDSGDIRELDNSAKRLESINNSSQKVSYFANKASSSMERNLEVSEMIFVEEAERDESSYKSKDMASKENPLYLQQGDGMVHPVQPEGGAVSANDSNGAGWLYYTANNVLCGPYSIDILRRGFENNLLPGSLILYYFEGGLYTGPYELKAIIGTVPSQTGTGREQVPTSGTSEQVLHSQTLLYP